MKPTDLLFQHVSRRALAGAIAIASLTLLSSLGLMVLSGWLITRAWQAPPILDLAVAITAVRALGLSRSVMRYVDRIVTHRYALSALSSLRVQVFQAAVSQGHVSDTQAQRALGADAQRVTDLIVRSIVPRGVAVALSVLAVAGALCLLPFAGLVLALGLLFTGVVIPRWVGSDRWQAIHTAEVAARDQLDESLDAVLNHRVEFQAAGLGDRRNARVVSDSQNMATASAHRLKRLAAIDATVVAVSGCTLLLVTGLGLHFYQGSPMWLGMLVLLAMSAFESHAPLVEAATHHVIGTKAAQRMTAFMEQAVEFPAPGIANATEGPALRVEDLTCAWGDNTWNFDVEFGQRHVIRGPSGCGKTTLLRTIAGLSPVVSGSVTIAGHTDTHSLRTWTRLFSEDGYIFATSIRENILVACPHASDELVYSTARAVGLGPWLDAHDGLDTILSDGAESISSGQRRRLLLTRALCSTAPIVLLDEPTAHIDDADGRRLLHMLLHEPLPGALPQRSVIVVTHMQ
ncbi:thiol reductant ABC exporter subunit CydC [Corynebacterium diphtheriae]|nr:thiol reductant ABC exporter subunit CydC [Corynebacterium diphtheriae]